MATGNIFTRLKRYYHNRKKNLFLNQNVRRFMASHAGGKELPREAEFRPEVLIPCYNHGRYLSSALSSVPEGIPVTVINDASTDDTYNLAEKLKCRFNFRLIHNERNLNQAGSLNEAISLSENNMFIVLNADDFLLKYCIPVMLAIFSKFPAVRLAGGGCIPFSGDGILRWNEQMPERLGYEPKVKIYGPAEAINFKRLNDINMTMSGCTFLRSAWEAVGGFRDFAHRVCCVDDRDFQMRVSTLFQAAVIEEPLSLYRTDSSTGRARYMEAGEKPE